MYPYFDFSKNWESYQWSGNCFRAKSKIYNKVLNIIATNIQPIE